jgi:hypothetical protein
MNTSPCSSPAAEGPPPVATSFPNILNILTVVTLGTVMLTGCAPRPQEAGPVGGKTAACSLAILAANDSAIPTRIQVTFSNLSNARVKVALPGPLCGESETQPVSFIGIILKDPSGRKEEFTFVHPDARSPRKTRVSSLKPAGSVAVNYALDDFYRWGPCGPDRWGNFVKYFQTGATRITMQAVWLTGSEEGESTVIKSNLQSFTASHPDWLFKD